MNVGVAVAVTVFVDATPRVVTNVDIAQAGRSQLGVFFQHFHERAVVVVFGQIHAQNSFRLQIISRGFSTGFSVEIGEVFFENLCRIAKLCVINSLAISHHV